MPDPNLPAASRRLAALLRDEEYGPKLVRLNKTDERIVLDLIYENRGREARKELLRLDENRRTTRTIRSRVREYVGMPKRQRSAEWRNVKKKVKDHEQEFWRLYKAGILAS